MTVSEGDAIGFVVEHIRIQLRTHLFRKRRELVTDRSAYVRSLNGHAIVLRQIVIDQGMTAIDIRVAIARAVNDSEIVQLLGEVHGSLHLTDARHKHHQQLDRTEPQPFVRLLTAR
jgi:hypothetical protein